MKILWSQQLFLPDESAVLKLGEKLGPYLKDHALRKSEALMVYLDGDLGAGKTTLTRGILAGLGYPGIVKSPTFTIVEPYSIDNLEIFHFDLYRLTEPEELLFLGGRDYYSQQALCLVEWPDLGRGVLPEPDLTVKLSYEQTGRRCELISYNLQERCS